MVAMTDIRELEPREAQDWLQRTPEAQLLDVREEDEYERVRIPGVKLIPLGQVSERYQELDGQKPVLCICAGGVRSMRAAQFLKQQGFSELVNLTGGTKAWVQEGLPSES